MNRQLQKAETSEEVYRMTATQIQKLMQRNILIYPAQEGALSKGILYPADASCPYSAQDTDQEQDVIDWVWQNRKRAGATTQNFPKGKTTVSCHSYWAADLRRCRDSDGKANAA